MSRSWIKGFEVARAASFLAIAPRAGLRIGAALYSKSNLLSIGFNTFNVTHPEAERNEDVFNRNVHAEHRAIIKRQHYNNANLTMYVHRELADGTLANCRPCKQCQLLMLAIGVKRVRYTDRNTFAEMIL
jgi:deoxycytidylate deaminase